VGSCLFLLTWWIISFEAVTGEVTSIGRVYRGNTVSPTGSFIGLIWAFVDDMIAGALFALLYNFIAARISRQANT
jgi:hypothetical protein